MDNQKHKIEEKNSKKEQIERKHLERYLGCIVESEKVSLMFPS
jgi:hypothetical protein